MIRIDTSPVWYYSQLDEDAFFRWAQEIPCVKSIDGGFFHIRSRRLSKADLWDLIAIMHRYKMPMVQLRIFLNKSNEHWFKDKKMYFYKQVWRDA